MTSNRAQSESIGVILMVGIVVITVTTAGAFYLSTVAAEDTTSADVGARITPDGVLFFHGGGEDLPTDDLRVVVRSDGTEWRPDFDAGGVYDGDGDDAFEPGERWANVSIPFDEDSLVRVFLVDTRTGTVLVDEERYPRPEAGGPGVAPDVGFSHAPTNPNVGERVDFTDQSTDYQGDAVSWEWDFDDDGTTDATGQTAHTSFSSGGEHDVTLTVTDAEGHTASDTRTVVVNRPPSAAFSSSPSNPDPGETVTFDGTGSSDPDGSVASYAWDFDGDGTTDATGPTATHTYATPGRYDVTLTVTDDDGDTGTVTHEVVVGDPPSASFTVSGAYATDDATFDASGSSDPDGSITTYEWDFDDDGVTDATGEVVQHTYDTQGTYTVSLTVTDDTGLTDTRTKSVSVAPAEPQVTGVDVAGAPWGENDTGQGKTVTVHFDRPMDTGVTPSVAVQNVSATTSTANPAWPDNETFTVDVTIGDADEETTAHLRISGAKDETGDEMLPNDSTAVTVDTVPPTVTDVEADNPSGDVVRVTVDADERLVGMNVTLTNESGDVVATLHEGDFTESGSGPYAYTANHTVSEDGDYTVTVETVSDVANTVSPGTSDRTTVGPSRKSMSGATETGSKPNSGKVVFDVTNDGYENVTVVAVKVTTTSDATRIYEDVNQTTAAPENVEVYVDATTPGWVESDDLASEGVPLDQTVSMSRDAVIGPRSTATFTLYQFQKAKKKGKGYTTAKLKGETVRITVTFSDGSTKTFTVTL